MNNDIDFKDIAPFDDSEFRDKMRSLVQEKGLEAAIKYVIPDVDYANFVENLLAIPNKEYFQARVMLPFLEMLEQKTTSGITMGGFEHLDKNRSYTFISNHRDIVLDASFLNLCLFRAGFRTSEVAIGDNLLIYDWITDLVKLNKSFIVRRNLRAMQALDAAKKLSAYIHYAINDKHESVWIAQREGRAKDSNDRTQESLIKMLALSGEGSLAERLAEINLVPISISYEYDPNDYLKAKEFLMKKENPTFKKSPNDDLKAMETGILSYKGHVHFQIGPCISDEIRKMAHCTDRQKVVKTTCAMIDSHIHSGYDVMPINYIAHDLLEVTDIHRDCYDTEQFLSFRDYIEKQLDRTDIPGLTPEQRGYMYKMMLTMYANPLKNKIENSRTPQPCE